MHSGEDPVSSRLTSAPALHGQTLRLLHHLRLLLHGLLLHHGLLLLGHATLQHHRLLRLRSHAILLLRRLLHHHGLLLLYWLRRIVRSHRLLLHRLGCVTSGNGLLLLHTVLLLHGLLLLRLRQELLLRLRLLHGCGNVSVVPAATASHTTLPLHHAALLLRLQHARPLLCARQQLLRNARLLLQQVLQQAHGLLLRHLLLHAWLPAHALRIRRAGTKLSRRVVQGGADKRQAGHNSMQVPMLLADPNHVP